MYKEFDIFKEADEFYPVEVVNVIKELELRGYQTDLVDLVRKSIMAGHKRILLQLWVGGGKTIISAEIMKLAAVKLKRSLFVAPRRQLVYQSSETFTSYGINNGMIMAGEQRFNQPLIQVGSIDTITCRVNSGKIELPQADFLIVDEAHAVFSKERLKILSQYKIVIGITSTPALANGKGMGSFYTDMVQGPTMKEMVDMGFLVPMRYFGADAPDLAAVKLNADGDYQERALAEASDKPELIGAIYDNYKKIAGNRSTLIFAVNRKHAQSIFQEFLSHGVKADYIDGNTETEERDAIRDRVISGETKVVINIVVLAFGTDWGIFSCVIIARVTKNISAWIQMIGRGSRLHPGKNDCYVIYHGTNWDELGRIDDDIEWSLDDKTTVKERKEKAKKESSEGKDITCRDCSFVFRASKSCPRCGCTMIQRGEAIPTHAATLVELTKVEKFTPAQKQQFYSELIGFCRRHSKPDSFGLAIFKEKYSEWPFRKNIPASEPSIETLNYIKSRQIAYSYHKRKTNA